MGYLANISKTPILTNIEIPKLVNWNGKILAIHWKHFPWNNQFDPILKIFKLSCRDIFIYYYPNNGILLKVLIALTHMLFIKILDDIGIFKWRIIIICFRGGYIHGLLLLWWQNTNFIDWCLKAKFQMTNKLKQNW